MIGRYKRLLDVFMDQSHKETFGKFITPSYKLIDCHPNQGYTFSYTIPKRICRQFISSSGDTGDSRPQFSTSGAMAVFDQLSTYGLMGQDKFRPRGGVSVLLSTEVLAKSFPDQEVIVKSKCDKIGKSLGFCTMELYAQDGTILARGKHIKYLPLGLAWDIMFHPWMISKSLAFHDYMNKTVVFDKLREMWTNIPKHHRKAFPVCEDTGSVFDSLGLQSSNYDLGIKSADNFVDAVHTRTYQLLLKPHLVNNIGKLHGGAVAALVEEACYKYRVGNAVNGTLTTDYFIKSIEARYESAMEVICLCLFVTLDFNYDTG